MAVDRLDRVECILDQGFEVLGGGLEDVRISEETAGFLRDLCLPVISEVVQAGQWTPVAVDSVWRVVRAIGVEARAAHSSPGELTVEEIIQAIWRVVRGRNSFICLKLIKQLTVLGYPEPLV